MTRRAPCLLLGILSLASACGRSTPTGSVAIDPPHQSRSEDESTGKDVEFRFRIHNGSQTAVSLGPIRASCGCSNNTLTKRRLAPGEEAFLETRVSRSGFGRTVRLSVATSDPVNPVLDAVAETRASLKPPCLAREPDIVEFGPTARGGETRKIVVKTVEPRGDRPPWLLSARAGNAALSVRTLGHRTIGDMTVDFVQREYEFEVAVRPFEKPTSLRDEIQLLGEGGERHGVVFVNGELAPPVTVAPTAFMIDSAESFPLRRRIVVSSATPFTLRLVSAPPGIALLGALPSVGQSHQTFELSIDRPSDKKAAAELVFGCSVKEQPTIRIPIRFF